MELPAKKDVCNALLLRSSVFLHLDPRVTGVLIPDRLRKQPQVTLQVGNDMPIPIPDLKVDDNGVYGTLSFKGVPYTCWIPWSAVFAVVGEDAKGVVWDKEIPREVKENIERQNKPAEIVQLNTAKPKKASAKKPASKNTSRPSYLRLVK